MPPMAVDVLAVWRPESERRRGLHLAISARGFRYLPALKYRVKAKG